MSIPKQRNSGKKSHTIALRSNIKDKSRIVFVRMHSSRYHRLSVNIVREICDYFRDPDLLIVNRDRKVFQFNPASKQFTPFFELTCMRGYGSLLNSTFIGPNKVFMVLRNSTAIHQNPPYFAAYISEKLVDYGYRYDCCGCALAYDPVRDCVYIFGGQTFRTRTLLEPIKSSEKFAVATSRFERLTDMQRERCWLGCCWHTGVAFLCGGGHSSIETFDPRTETFAEHSVLDCDLEKDSSFNAVSVGAELIVLSPASVWRVRGTQIVKRRRGQDDERRSVVNGTAVMWANTLYFSTYAGSYAVYLESGRETYYHIARTH